MQGTYYFEFWRLCVHLLYHRHASVPSATKHFASQVATARTWNSLPPEVTSSRTLSTFKHKLKTYLFSLSFPWFVVVKYLLNIIIHVTARPRDPEIKSLMLYRLSYSGTAIFSDRCEPVNTGTFGRDSSAAWSGTNGDPYTKSAVVTATGLVRWTVPPGTVCIYRAGQCSVTRFRYSYRGEE